MTKLQVENLINSIEGDNVWIDAGWGILKHKISNLTYQPLFIRYNDYNTTYYSSIRGIFSEKPIDIGTTLTFGSDPEFFFIDKDNEVIPSTVLVPAGLEEVKPDGFQGELNPETSTCRAIGGSNVWAALDQAVGLASKAGAKISFSVGHIISDKVWKSTPLSLRRFGCNPTINAHETKFKRITGLREKFRAAGGHIHLGDINKKEKDNANKLVTIMDIVAGNTCVLVDRDENNARRRVMYGRAGEYRLKSYGLEYRVFSNFWLKHYTLWSMATVLLRNAVGIYRVGLADELISKFDLNKVRDAINLNDKELAMENFKILVKFIKDKTIACGSGLSAHNTDKVLEWLSTPDPISYLNVDTTEKVLAAWRKRQREGEKGFESFIETVKL